jgi:predicted nucleic acid-binding Zn ribbon protein|tara:strand:+ start:25943 stop:26209 length:267 start_codon:yes stop_codon:yes gene_type:complete
MPRYRYVCGTCDDEKIIFHLFGESIDLNCHICETLDGLERSLTSPTYLMSTPEQATTVGAVTEEYIEKNREVLEEERRKAKESTYEQN